MVDVAIDALGGLIKFALTLKQQREEIELQIKKIIIDCTGIQKGLHMYQTLTLDKEDQCILNLVDAIERTKKQIERVQKRGFLSKFCSSGNDLQILTQNQELIVQAYDSLQKMIEMGKNGITMQEVNRQVTNNMQVDQTLKSEASKIFWKNHVQDTILPMPIYNFGQYFKSFLAHYNSSEEGRENPIKLMYLEPIFARMVDSDQSGFVELHEIQEFFVEWWENQDKRKQFFKKLEANDEMIDESIFLFQALREVNCEQYYPLFKFAGFTAHQFLELTEKMLRYSFQKQITELEIVKIATYIKSLKKQIEYYKEIEQQTLKMVSEHRPTYKAAIDLFYEGKMTKQDMPRSNKWISEGYFQYKNGCGLSLLKDVENSTYLGISENYQPITPFMIQYDTEEAGGEINIVNLTKDYSEYFGYYYIKNQDVKKPFQVFAEHVGSQKRNDMRMQGYKKYNGGQIMGYTILDAEINYVEIPDGRQIYIDMQNNMMIKYFKWGVEVSFQEFQDYQTGKKKMSKVYAKQMVKQQKLFYYDCEDNGDNKSQASSSSTAINPTFIKIRNPNAKTLVNTNVKLQPIQNEEE